ncbi:MAG: GtrA family protein [Candidatus ainarchaeum sp.]|nr:GtrA family protein [Candidatus ainarchaeum sp.]MDD3975610.1 GtrA family protein [Candidatus ainarchaeum sp.]
MKQNILDKIFDILEKHFKFFKHFRKIGKYLFFSVIATLVDIVCLYIFTEFLNVFYLVSASLSYCVGMVIAFFGNKKYTFENKTDKKNITKFIEFTIISLIGLVLNIILIKIFTENLGLWYILSKIITVVIIFFAKYIAHKKIVFRN